MNTQASTELLQVIEHWTNQDRQLLALVDGIRDWMAEVNQLGIPHFGETASRLQPLRMALESHFRCEDEMLEVLGQMYGDTSPEVSAFKRQTDADHRVLLMRLDDLCERLLQIEPPFGSWTSAMNEVDVFFESLQQHELQESDRWGMLAGSEEARSEFPC